MRPESVSSARFQNACSTTHVRTTKAMRACIKDPTPEAIHETRIAIRKLTTAVSLMPRRFRRDDQNVKTMEALRLFYTDCAKLRDVDAMMSALSTYVAIGDLGDVMAGLKKRRLALASRVVSSGYEELKFALRGPANDTRGRLSKRLKKLLKERGKRAIDLYWIAARGEKKVAELHRLRKECRHIMYLLDFANDEAKVKSIKLDLEEAREKLGSMRDDDLLLDLLGPTKDSTPAAKVAAAVRNGRLIKYRKFFHGQTVRGKGSKLVESILSLT